MISCRDPSQMTAEECRLELAELLASAYLRILASRKESRNPLDHSPESEPSCALVNGVEITPGKESA